MNYNDENPVYSTMDGKPSCEGSATWVYVGGCPGIDWEVTSNNCTGYKYIPAGGTWPGGYVSCSPTYPGESYGNPIPEGATTVTTSCG